MECQRASTRVASIPELVHTIISKVSDLTELEKTDALSCAPAYTLLQLACVNKLFHEDAMKELYDRIDQGDRACPSFMTMIFFHGWVRCDGSTAICAASKTRADAWSVTSFIGDHTRH